MKVLQINSVCGVGSTGRIATDIHALLKEKGYESYIAYGRKKPKNCETALRIGTKIDTIFHVVKTRLFDRHGFGSRKATYEFINRIENLNPDVIHLHNLHGYYLNIEVLFSYLKKANKPVIWTLHDCWPFTGHCAYFDFKKCMCWTGKHKCVQKNSYPTSYLVNNSIKNYRRKKDAFTGVPNLTIVTPSIWLAKLVEESFLGDYPVKIINNGIDLDIFQPSFGDFRKTYNLEQKFIILGIANIWDERKGYKFFKELASYLHEDEIIVLVGLSPKQINKLPKNIIGISQTDNVQELVELYSTANVFVNPTLEDNFPTTNLEALACGIPVITFNTGGSVEAIDESCGYVVEQGDIKGLLKKIASVKKKGNLSYKSNAVNRAHHFYNMRDKYMEYISLYEMKSISSGN